MRKKTIFELFTTCLLISFTLLNLNSCTRGSSNSSENQYAKGGIPGIIGPENKIKKVTYFLENSESMFGYVKGLTEYVDVVSELAEKPEFTDDHTVKDFYFINGEPLSITHIGNSTDDLRKNLNTNGYRCGDITKSNLNEMFHIALEKAKGDSISILISDGIYDIGNTIEPLRELVVQKDKTRTKFIERLNDGQGNLQTLLIKMNSDFNGKYFFSTRKGFQNINNKRPYYIWIFGESELLNKYFTENYISEELNGYESMVRFFRIDKINLLYQATSNNRLGDFMFDKSSSNILTKAKQDRNGLGFQFDIAVDFSSLPLPESYKCSPDNYSCPGNFIVSEIKRPQTKIFEVTRFTPTHLITLFTDKSPYGLLEINLKNNVPKWIEETNSENETDIQSDTLHTYGFKYLTDGISGAYQHISRGKNIGSFKIEIFK